MDVVSDKIAFIREFRDAARQLRDFSIAGDWMRLAWALRDNGIDLTAVDAAAWADLGFRPAEAAPLIASGISPATYREMEDHAEQQAGGTDAHAAERIAQMFADGSLVSELELNRED